MFLNSNYLMKKHLNIRPKTFKHSATFAEMTQQNCVCMSDEHA